MVGGETLQKYVRDRASRRPRPPPLIPKWRAFRAKRETAKGTRIPIDHVLLREPTSRP